MKLITKVTLLLAGVFTIALVVNFAVLNTTVMSSYAALERGTALQNADRVKQAIDREFGFLKGIGGDWASWTDTRDFALGRKPEYVELNLTTSVLTGHKTNSLFLVGNDGTVLWGLSIDLETEEKINIAELPATANWTSHPLLQKPSADVQDMFTGVIKTDHGIMLTVSAPILDSDSNGPSAGTLVWGKLLTPTVLETLAQQTSVELELVDPDAGGLPDGLSGSDEAIVVETSDTVLNGYQLLRDVSGAPVSVLKSGTSRAITQNGARTIMTAMGLLVLSGLAVMVAVAFGLRAIALQPLHQLTNTVLAITRTGNLKSRSGMTRDDEIGVLSQQFDQMLEELLKARETMRQQSYYTGILEMSAGLMHNLRNSLNPVTTGIWSALEILRQNRLENFDRAIKELAEIDGDSDRRTKLFSYVGQVARQIGEERATLTEKITRLQTETRAIGEMLDQQNKLNRPDLCVEAVDLRDVIDSAVGQVPQNRGILLDVVCPDDGLIVAGNKILIAQILSNILLNAVESIEATGRGEGTIKVLVSREGEPGAQYGRITVKDDGAGIPADVLPRIFQRGFSTRGKISGGLGLHWCSNTTIAMGGSIILESDGAGKGAMARVDLKVAADQAAAEAA